MNEHFIEDVINGGAALIKALCSGDDLNLSGELASVNDAIIGCSGKSGNQKSKLKSIFSSIDINRHTTRTATPKYYQAASLDLKRMIPIDSDDTVAEEDLTHLHDDFLDEFHNIKTIKSPKNRLTTFYYLYQKHASLLASPVGEDVSLFDYWRLAAALRFTGWKAGGEFLLVSGDLSGMQELLYTIGSARAAKSLRARSQYLKMISDFAALALLQTADLPLTNQLFSAGGNFLLLVPQNYRDKLAAKAKRLNDILIDIHSGRLSIAIAFKEATLSQLFGYEFDSLRQQLSRALNENKRRISADERGFYDNVFVELSGGGIKDECDVCGRQEPSLIEGKCGFCYSLESGLNSEIVRASALSIIPATPRDTEIASWQDVFQNFGFKITFHSDRFAAINKQPQATYLSINSLPDFNANNNGAAIGFTWMSKNIPKTGDSIKDFEQIAESTEGAKRIACLRLDVDNLGKVFKDGLNHPSIVDNNLFRYLTLSRSLGLFFDAYLSNVILNNTKYSDIYLVYSGGDDVCMIGPWSQIPELAITINNAFKEYTAYNKQLSISGGIKISYYDFPVHRLVGEAGRGLDKAKDYYITPNGQNIKYEKDAITMFNRSFIWSDFEGDIKKYNDDLVELIKSKAVPRSFLYGLAAVYNDFLHQREQSRRKKARNGKVLDYFEYDKVGFQGVKLWRLVNFLSKHQRKIKKSEDKLICDNLKKWLTKGYVQQSPSIAYLGIQVRWAEYLTRPRKADNE